MFIICNLTNVLCNQQPVTLYYFVFVHPKSSQKAFKVTVCMSGISTRVNIHTGKNICSTFFFGSLSHKQDFTLMPLSEMRLKGLPANNEAVGGF